MQEIKKDARVTTGTVSRLPNSVSLTRGFALTCMEPGVLGCIILLCRAWLASNHLLFVDEDVASQGRLRDFFPRTCNERASRKPRNALLRAVDSAPSAPCSRPRVTPPRARATLQAAG